MHRFSATVDGSSGFTSLVGSTHIAFGVVTSEPSWGTLNGWFGVYRREPDQYRYNFDVQIRFFLRTDFLNPTSHGRTSELRKLKGPEELEPGWMSIV